MRRDDPPPTLRPVPCTLAGWPAGSIYPPRTPLLMADMIPPDDVRDFRKQHRGRGRKSAP